MKNLNEMTAKELKEMAKELKVANWWNLKKSELISGIEMASNSETNSDKTDESEEFETNIIEETVNEPMKMSDTITILEDMFDKLNAIYFEDALPKPVITVQSTPKAYGHCSTKKIWKAGDNEAMYEINLGAEFINRPIQETAATLTHEMIHLYCIVNEIADTCQNGRYHNKTFKLEAEARDLEAGYDRANGYTHTAPTETFVNKITEAGINMTIRFARILKAPIKRERNKQYKYVCPVCGQYVKSASELHIKCANCDAEMIRK
ncbi:MAG: SprT-like domain-containing protein [Clostridia bacterium]|nr:SprT-like domain-containing protein [Clostridia bacterium]